MPEVPKEVRTKEQAHTDLAHLNAAQREAVTHEGGPLLVIAGAGTGKTAVITERIAWLIREKGYRPDSILALTFTGKAALEMEERMDRLLPLGYSQMWVDTFHGFGERVLRDAALEIGLDPAFRVLSVPQQWLLVRRHLFELPLRYFRPLGNPTKFLRALVRAIGAAKDQDLPPEKFDQFAHGEEEAAERVSDATERDALRETAVRWREFASAYRVYNALLLRESAMDFGDLILNTLRLFREHPSVLRRFQEQFRAILVDEFQDTNGSQNELLRLLVGQPVELRDSALLADDGAGDITVVGDDDQSIYAWRGSNITNILGFQQMPSARKIVLTENYRSPQEILDAAYVLIQHNNPYRLEKTADVVKKLSSTRTTTTPFDHRISHRHFETVEQESKFITENIVELVKENVCQYRDCAILTRTNAQADDIVPSLIQRDIPYHVAEARGLLLRPEIRDVAAYVRVVVEPENTVALFRVLSLSIFHLVPFERARLLSEAKRTNRSLVDLLRDAKALTLLSPRSREGIQTLVSILDADVSRGGSVLPSQVMLGFLQKSGYLEHLLRMERQAAEAVPNLAEFLNFIKEYERSEPEGSLLGFVEFLNLVVASGESPAQAVLPPDVDAVRIMTVHGAKGLEFPVVFLLGATRDKYPVRDQTEPLELPEAFAPQQDIDPRDAHILEERRLFYVAMTRAKERLYITSAARVGSQRVVRKPSPFIREAGLETIHGSGEATQAQQLMLPMAAAPPPVAPASMLTLPATISVSQVETYETCPLKYQFQYVYRVPVPPHHALTFGTAVHAVLRDLARLVMAGKKPTLDDASALYEKHWSPEGFESKHHEAQQKQHGQELLAAYLRSHPELLARTPLFVEEPFRFRLDDVTVVGRMDRVDRNGSTVAVTDFKTGTAKDQKTADEGPQLSVYALALREVFHLHADRLTLSFLEGSVDRHTARTDEDLEKAKERLLATAERIRARDFTATPGSHVCRFCEFRTICDFSAV
jgi:DNA helicase-2/ATP-dependent DNA helicase PcrA